MSSVTMHNPLVGKKSTVVNQKLKQCLKKLEHASYCDEKECNTIGCVKIKKLRSHKLECTRKGCKVCRQFIILCCCHAKHCSNSQCIVPHCSRIKTRLRLGSGKDEVPFRLTIPKNDKQQPNKHVEMAAGPSCVLKNETEEAARKKAVEFSMMSLEDACCWDFEHMSISK